MSNLEQATIGQGTQILDMIGPEGLFAILATIVWVRIIKNFFYMDKGTSFFVTVLVSVVIGSLAVYYGFDSPTVKQISGGAFMTLVGAPIAYELIRWSLKLGMEFRYEKPGFKTLQAMYFFITPKPIKIKRKNSKKEKVVVEVEPHSALTKFFRRSRVKNGMRFRSDEDDIM